jgi:hypothetical protein
LWIAIKIFFIFFYKEGYVFQKLIEFTIVAGYTSIFLKNSFIGYVYFGFQISKHGGYALKICISKFQFYYLIKRSYNSSLAFQNTSNMNKFKQNQNLWGESKHNFKELCPSAAQAPCPTHTKHNPSLVHKINHRQPPIL